MSSVLTKLTSHFQGGCALLSLALIGACGLGSADPGSGDGPTRIPADDPAIDDRLDTLGIICESTLLVTGSYTPGEPPPADHFGCWPVGTWTINATIDRLGCDPQPLLTEDMVYNVIFDEEDTTINVIFNNDPSDERVNMKISTEGDSLCHGIMEHYATDGTVWSFRPVQQLDGTLPGIGTYSVHEEDPF